MRIEKVVREVTLTLSEDEVTYLRNITGYGATDCICGAQGNRDYFSDASHGYMSSDKMNDIENSILETLRSELKPRACDSLI